jgi:hypothetical protein
MASILQRSVLVAGIGAFINWMWKNKTPRRQDNATGVDFNESSKFCVSITQHAYAR